MRIIYKFVPVFILAFVLGFAAHQQNLHQPIRGFMAYATGNAGSCGLTAILEAPSRSKRLKRRMQESRSEGKIVERAPDGFTRWSTPLGSLWTPPGNTPIYAVGEQLAEVYTEGEMKLGPGDVVLDCGANIGDFVRVCLRAGVTKVVAIEPSPNNVEAMRRSFSEEIARGQVVIVPKGVWHEDSTMTMSIYENSLLDSFVMNDRRENLGKPRPREIELPVTTIDSIVEELGLEKVTFLKMDIEGAERNAIRGAAKTITRFGPRMALATENLEDDYIAVPQEVQKLGRKYSVRCGLCRLEGWLTYRPDIMFFTL